MIQFFILNGTNKRACTAIDEHKAAEILRLMFHSSKGYVVENNKISFAQNMTIDEAEIAHGIKPMQSMTVLPAKVKPKKRIAVAVGMTMKKPAKSKAKKTTLKSKVVIKNNKKAVAKKTVVKGKPKKVNVKKPVAKVKVKGKKR